MVNNKPSMDVAVLRLAEKYGRLPSEILAEDLDWFHKMLLLPRFDNERAKLEERRNAWKNYK